MSRYVAVPLEALRREELLAALTALDIPHEVARADRIQLDGSLECVGEPVDVRVPPGVAGSSEDFGFVRGADGTYQLVCGDVDRTPLTRHLLAPLRAEVARRRVAAATGATVDTHLEADGTHRLVVRPGRSGREGGDA